MLVDDGGLPRPVCRHLLELTRGAFETCIHTFTTPAILPPEHKCLESMAAKYIATSLRVSARFAELQAAAAEQQASDAKNARSDLSEKAAELRKSGLV